MSSDLQSVRARFRDGRCHHVVLPQRFSEDRTAPLRTQLDKLEFEAFYEPDRGRYEINRNLDAPDLFEELRDLVATVVERPVRIGQAQWLRLRHRNYALLKDAAKSRIIDGTFIEATIDLSTKGTAQAEIIYSDGVQSWVVPQEPGSVAIVERESWLYRYERYLDQRVADALVYRLRLALL